MRQDIQIAQAAPPGEPANTEAIATGTVITALQGAAQVVRADGSVQDVTIGMVLQAGDQIVAADGSQVVVAPPNGPPRVLSVGASPPLNGTAANDRPAAPTGDGNAGSAASTTETPVDSGRDSPAGGDDNGPETAADILGAVLSEASGAVADAFGGDTQVDEPVGVLGVRGAAVAVGRAADFRPWTGLYQSEESLARAAEVTVGTPGSVSSARLTGPEPPSSPLPGPLFGIIRPIMDTITPVIGPPPAAPAFPSPPPPSLSEPLLPQPAPSALASQPPVLSDSFEPSLLQQPPLIPENAGSLFVFPRPATPPPVGARVFQGFALPVPFRFVLPPAEDPKTLNARGETNLTGGTNDSDVAVFLGQVTDYTFSIQGNLVTVEDLQPNRDGVTTLSKIEILRFMGGGRPQEFNLEARTASDSSPIIGSGDNDLAVFTGLVADYRFSLDATGRVAVVEGDGQGAKTHTLDSIERLRFETAGQSEEFNLVFGTNGNDGALTGGAQADVMIGGAGDDVISGGAGNDVITGGRGNDTISGGGGDDMAVFSGPVSGYGFSLDAAGRLTVTDARAAGDGVDTLAGIERLRFEADTTGEAFNLVFGTNGNDGALTGTAGRDIILGGGGNDIITAGDGDIVDGGGGHDILSWTGARLDLGANSGINDIETIELAAANAVLTLTPTGVKAATSDDWRDSPTGQAHSLIVRGDSGDQVELNRGDFTGPSGAGIPPDLITTYSVYSAVVDGEDVRLYIDPDITVTFV